MPKESRDQNRELRLDQFLKLSGIAGTGGHAKLMIQGGDVLVNGELETRRRRKLNSGDVVQVGVDDEECTKAVVSDLQAGTRDSDAGTDGGAGREDAD